MFAPKYFAPRYFAPRYWPPGVGVVVGGISLPKLIELALAQEQSFRLSVYRNFSIPLIVVPVDRTENFNLSLLQQYNTNIKLNKFKNTEMAVKLVTPLNFTINQEIDE